MSDPIDRFERLEQREVWRGRMTSAFVERYRHADGTVVERERIAHPGAVCVIAHDDTNVLLVRQPREIVGDPALLELPAGKLDVQGEAPVAAAARELEEETGRRAGSWERALGFFSSPGFTDEWIELYRATELSETGSPRAGVDEERIEVVAWPLAELDDAIAHCQDAKSLIGLLWLRCKLAVGGS